MNRIHTLLIWACLVLPSAAADVHFEGILGNSGETGPGLVHFGAVGQAGGIGVVVDRFGSLWDRGGAGTLNRYAPDGRLLGRYPIASAVADSDQIALAGDTLVLLLGSQLYTLAVDAVPGTEAKALGVAARCLSPGSLNGAVAIATEAAVCMLDPATAAVTKVADMKDVQMLDVAPDGALLVAVGGKVSRLVAGQPVGVGWPKPQPGDRMQVLDGAVFAHAWHGTIRRFTLDLEPDPGVVIGGASGSFIGHLDQNSELFHGRGMATLRAGVYALSGIGGILHLARWDAAARQITLVRRIGCVPVCRGLGLSRDGMVWWQSGMWQWTDTPDAPMRQGVNPPEHPGTGQAVMLDNDCLVAAAYLWGRPAFYHGRLLQEVSIRRVEDGCALPREAAAATVYRRDGTLVLLTLTAAGEGHAFAIGGDGSYQSEAGPVVLAPAAPVREWTSLAMRAPDRLLAAADGAVLEFAPNGADWHETGRWRADFGARIWIALDAGRLWVADCERHRVVVCDPVGGQALAAYGTADREGSVPGALSAPQALAARGDRAVVFDSGNQRLVKLRLE